MRLDQYSNPIFNEQDLFDALYKGQTIPNYIFADPSSEISQLKEISGLQFSNCWEGADVSIEGVDHAMQQDWFMPEEYKTMDIIEWVMIKCPPENQLRAAEELEAFEERNMLDLLRWLKYFVDTMRANNVVCGVGRGSSVSSYVLYLLDIHKIDSVKYNLDWREFLR